MAKIEEFNVFDFIFNENLGSIQKNPPSFLIDADYQQATQELNKLKMIVDLNIPKESYKTECLNVSTQTKIMKKWMKKKDKQLNTSKNGVIENTIILRII